MEKKRVIVGLSVAVLILSGLACQLTSPRPASWAGTPTAEARAMTATMFALTQEQVRNEEPTPAPTFTPEPLVTIAPTSTPTPIGESEGPWLVYPAPSGDAILAYDVNTGVTLSIDLPEPIFTEDLVRGLAPDGRTLVIRAGSPLHTDELALYQIDLPSTEATVLTPLLSLPIQRKIVNQQGTRVFEVLEAVTRPEGLAWSPNGMFLAFNAALHNESSDLYVIDRLNDRIIRLSGLYSQNASPAWSPNSNWLVTQELNFLSPDEIWRSEQVTGIRVPNFDGNSTLYLPPPASWDEKFLGWINAQIFASYSLTEDGPSLLRQVNVENRSVSMVFNGSFDKIAFDPVSRSLAMILNYEKAISQEMDGGIYLIRPDRGSMDLLRAGDWRELSWEPGGWFVATGNQGAFIFRPEDEGILLPGARQAHLSPNGNWLIAWGDDTYGVPGARLYQPATNNPLQTLMTTPVERVLWQSDSRGFFILSEGTLSHFVFPALRPEEIIGGFVNGHEISFAWIE